MTTISSLGFDSAINITTIQNTLDISVDIAAPDTPILNTNIRSAFPATLKTLDTTDTTIGYLELPHDLNNAEPAENSAKNG